MKILVIAAVAISSPIAPVSANEDFAAIRQFLDSTSPLEAKSEHDDNARGDYWQHQDRDSIFVQSRKGQHLALELLGRTVVNSQGEFLGEIQDLVIGPNGRIVGIVVSRGGFFGFGGQKVGVSWSQVTGIGEVVEIKLYPFKFADAPGFVPPPKSSSKE